MVIDRFNITHITCKTISVFDCWKLYDTLIILSLIDIYKRFRLFIHKEATCVWHCSTCLQRDVECISF